MTEISRKALFAKLNSLSFQTLEGATVLCKLRGNPFVELVHWVSHILQQNDSDWHHLLRSSGVEPAVLIAEVNNHLNRLPLGANQIRDLSDDILHAVERAWMFASVQFERNQIRSADILLGLIKTHALRQNLIRISSQFGKLDPATMMEMVASGLPQSPECGSNPRSDHALPGEASGATASASAAMCGESALSKYTQDLTEQARQGKIDPVTGREVEIRQLMDILQRRRQNNPLITGEAGVGKTAVVEGFARLIVEGVVPPALRNVRLLSLDLGLLQAGASMKGEFEQRLRQVIDEVQNSPQPVVLFIDEIHTLIGAGGAAGTGDAANLLKPALARGSLRTIGATTWAEYKKHIEKDPALTRRFQVIQVHEPEEALGIAMLRGLVPALEKHHGVHVLDESVKAAVKLSSRYIPARQLPDKAISLLDTACARVAISHHAQPAQLEALKADMEALKAEQTTLQSEATWGPAHKPRLLELQSSLNALQTEWNLLEQQWTQERELIAAILKIRRELLETDSSQNPDVPAMNRRSDLQALEGQLKALQGEKPLMYPQVDEQAIAAVVSDWTGIPLGRMVKNELQSVLSLAQVLSDRIVGQDHALSLIAKRVQTSRAQLEDPNKPIGVFLLAGTSGVGKTETALALAETLYGGEQNLITINMSEYQEPHTVSSLKGSPPGYVGYGEGGVLTEAVRRRPYSVVLLDEVEKAHPDVHELFFQVFDKGWMEDGEGRRIDFKNTLILLTTNVGTDELMQVCQRGQLRPDPEHVNKVIRPALLKVFPPALLGRLTSIPYYPLGDDLLMRIITLQMDRLHKRIHTQHQIELTWDAEVLEEILSRCQESDSGGRVVGSILSNSLLPDLSRLLLESRLDGRELRHIHLGIPSVREAGQSAFTYEAQDALKDEVKDELRQP
ncbi:MAG: type VI secretion system ATPase TssH [Limnobacter sp.]|nr:type VI secretion system ATPase TssH [Limnobacter sp.]